jgi:CRP-like cAMP-binding protein
MKSLEKMLAQHPFLADLDPRHLRQITGLATPMRFNAHQMIFCEGQPANEFYLICQGTVGIETALLGCEAIQIQTQFPGDVVGWSWLLPPYEWHYSARALEPTEVFALNGKALRARCEEDHDLGYEIMKRFALVIVQRLVATRARLLHYPDPSAPQLVPDLWPWPFHGIQDL